MGKIKEYLKEPEIKIAWALGFTIILLAYVSKHILKVEFSYLNLAVPGFVALAFEGLYQSKKVDKKYLRPLYWNIGIILSGGYSVLNPNWITTARTKNSGTTNKSSSI